MRRQPELSPGGRRQKHSYGQTAGFTEENEKFCNYQRVRDRLQIKLQSLFRNVKSRLPDTESVAIYGELFGGVYSHPEVEAVKNVSKIQKGVDYHPDIDFYAFDILINNDTYLSVDLANRMFDEAGLFYAPTLFRGSLTDALAYPNEFDSKIGEWLGLPSIQGNTCEGVVIRPVEPLFLGHRSNSKRVLLKNKNTRWEENSRVMKIVRKEQLGNAAAGLQEILKSYLTTNRVQNVISKIGEVSIKQLGEIMANFMPDALEDFTKDYGEVWHALGKNDRKRVVSGLNKYAVCQIRGVLQE